MKQLFTTLLSGIHASLKAPKYLFLSILLAIVMLILYAIIPVLAVSGNTLANQLDIFTFRDYAILVFLSVLSSLFITMQTYVMRQKRKIRAATAAGAGGLGALFAGVAGTAFCASCLAPLFAIFGIGFGGVVFVLEYRMYFVAAITALMLIAIYLTARKIANVCTAC